jgi:hypothetical protein
MRWAGHDASMGERNACRVLRKKPDKNGPLERHGKFVLKWILEE